MKQVYQTMMAACVLAATGTVSASADYWSVSISDNAVAASEIEVGKPYILQSAASAKAGTAAYLLGQSFTGSTSGLNDSGAFLFIKANEQVNGNEVYYIQNKKGEYVARPGSATFFTKQLERAWKVVVLESESKNENESYDYVEDGKDPVRYTGINAYIWRAKAENQELNLQSSTFLEIDGQVVIASATPLKANDKFSQYNFLLGNTGSASIGTDYNQNAWIIRPANKIEILEALEVAMRELIPEGVTLAKHFEKYKVGTNAGEYDPEKYKAFEELWKKADDLVNKKITLSEEEIDKIIQELPTAYLAFVKAINPLKPGYYILTNWRGKNESNFDDAAMYDAGAVTYGSNELMWTLRPNDGVDYYEKDDLSYSTAKFVWEVIASDQPGKYYFRNLETGRYIGPQPNLTTAVKMTDKPVATFSMGANPKIPDYMTFYSDFLNTQYTNYNGLHTQVNGGKTVSWDVYSGGSMWHARTLTDEQVNLLKGLIAQPKRNVELTGLVDKAKTAIANGNLYYPVGTDGKKDESVLKGDFNEVNGLVTSKDQLLCPMGDPKEGTDINVMFDKDLATFYHTTYHGGEDAWDAHHFFTFNLAEAVNGIVVKWGERPVSNAVNGAPRNVVLWGAKDESALTKGKVQKVDKDGQPIAGQYNYDAWKNDGWVQLTNGTFNYDTKMLAADGTENGRKVGFASLGFDEGYKYLRLEFVDKMNGGASGFVYANELRVYKAEFDKEHSPNAAVPAEVMSELKALIKTAETELAAKAATEETIEKFKAAYEKFRANYPDATRVTDLTTQINTRLEKAAEDDTKLGYYATGAKAELQAARDKALADLKAITDVRAATLAEINNIVAALNAAYTTFESKLHVPTTGIYRIQSESQHKHVYGNLLSVRSSSITTYDQVCIAGRKASETATGEYVDTPDRNQHLDYYWQVEKVDGGYTFRNVFNGLYLSRDDKKQQRAMMLSETPYTFKVEFINFPGAFRFVSTDGKEDNYPYVNADPSSKTVVTWYSAAGNDNSAFSFHPADADQLKNILEEGFMYTLASKTGFQLITLPIDAEFEADDTNGNFYTVIGQKADTKDVVLKAVSDKKLKAGQAYVFKPGAQNAGTVKLYTTTQDVKELKPTNKAADPVNGLFGTFDFIYLRENNGLISPDRASVVLSEQGDRAAANTGYFGKLPETSEAGDLVIPAQHMITLIKTGVLQPSSKTKGTFTLSGVRVDDVQNLPAGLYVINGQKVIVK